MGCCVLLTLYFPKVANIITGSGDAFFIQLFDSSLLRLNHTICTLTISKISFIIAVREARCSHIVPIRGKHETTILNDNILIEQLLYGIVFGLLCF